MITFDRNFRIAGSWALAIVFCFAVCAGRPAYAQAPVGNDSALQSSVSSALARDPVLKDQPVIAATANGVVTLSGTVETEQQRQQAETDAANVQGVSGIQNNITVTGAAGAAEQQAPPPPDQQRDQQQNMPPPPPPPDQSQQPSPVQSPQSMPPPPPPDQSTGQAPYAQQGGEQQPGYNNYPPPQPPSGPVTIPAGTLVQIRLSEPLDVSKVQDGTVFQATAASDVFEGNVLAIPRGAVLQGTVVHAKKPGALGGSGELQLQITSVDLGGHAYPVTTDLWSNKGPNKAGYTASNTVGGAVVGALIGGLIGRGPGAAAGAIVGGGAGMAASAATNGPRVYLPAESLLNFHLSGPVTVQPVSWQEAQRLARNAPQLVRRPVYRGYYPYPYPYPYPYRAYGYPYPY
ncbi:MAG: BON domain-containing protein [Acidobacteriaceae bacterium]